MDFGNISILQQTENLAFAKRFTDFPTNEWYYNDAEGQSGITVRSPQSYTDGPGKELAKQCKAQRVQSTNQIINFSMVGLLIVIIVAPIIIITSWILAESVAKLPNRRAASLDGKKPEGKKRYKQRAYLADGNKNLLRLALRGGGVNTWENEKGDVPYRRELERTSPLLSAAKEEAIRFHYDLEQVPRQGPVEQDYRADNGPLANGKEHSEIQTSPRGTSASESGDA